MQFKEAAFEILKKAGKPLHYREITARALEAGLLDTSGQTPDASMGALLYTDTLKQDSRFKRADQRGTFTLKTIPAGNIQHQFESIQAKVQKDLKRRLLRLHPKKFEELIKVLLEEMGFEETETTQYSNDKGVDVRGVLRSNPLSVVKVAIQAKRWVNNVGSSVVRELRGSLIFADSEQGLIITPSDFTASAVKESQAAGRTPIQLINGDQLVNLLIQFKIGVELEEYVVPTIDNDYWSEIFGDESTDEKEEEKKVSDEPITNSTYYSYPMEIRGNYKGQTFFGFLNNLDGEVSWNDQIFPTPTNAAKAIVDRKTVNGWDFWRYLNPDNEKWEKIGNLRKKQIE